MSIPAKCMQYQEVSWLAGLSVASTYEAKWLVGYYNNITWPPYLTGCWKQNTSTSFYTQDFTQYPLDTCQTSTSPPIPYGKLQSFQ